MFRIEISTIRFVQKCLKTMVVSKNWEKRVEQSQNYNGED